MVLMKLDSANADPKAGGGYASAPLIGHRFRVFVFVTRDGHPNFFPTSTLPCKPSELHHAIHDSDISLYKITTFIVTCHDHHE
jgi:hypothetical protein